MCDLGSRHCLVVNASSGDVVLVGSTGYILPLSLPFGQYTKERKMGTLELSMP